jgi:pimeloyl-ACP methyl ester carboxylesterase
VKLLMRHPFDSARVAPSVRAPLLVVTGAADRIIPPSHSARLARAWGGKVTEQSFAGFGHNDLHLNPGYGSAIRAFLDREL